MQKINEEQIGACGDDCSYCLRYKATQSQNQVELKRIKDLWVSFGWKNPDVDSSELECWGCRKENKCAYGDLRNCAFEKGLRNCGYCKKYPCKLILEAFDRTETLFNKFNSKCSKEDRVALEKAFKNKKINLDIIHNEVFNGDVRDK